jgi:hypothetical protein
VAGFQRDEVARRRFPALDPEPPPPPWWRRLLVPVCVLAGVAVVVTAVRWLPSVFAGSPAQPAAAGRPGHPRAAGPAVRAGGRVVFVTLSGALALANADGSHLARASGLGDVGAALGVSPDNHYLSLLNGQVISIRRGPVLASYPAKVPLSSNTTVALPDPFADHERFVVMLTDYGDPTSSASNPISVISIATGRSVSLGTGDQVEGDPVARGVFAALAAPPRGSAVALQTNPDARVVLRDAGRPQAVLATAGALSHAVGLARSLPVSLAVYPAPSGAQVAVTVRPAAGGSDGGLVILSRSGRIVTTLRARGGTGPALGVPVWSGSGRALAYLSASTSGAPALSVWSGGGRVSASPLPSSAGRYGTCVWSPDGRSVLCPAGSGSEWVVAPAAGGPPAVARGPGFPVAWLP